MVMVAESQLLLSEAPGRSLTGGAFFTMLGHYVVFMSLLILTSADDNLTSQKDWDLLVFTQHWPATVCHQWKEKNPHHDCTFPSQKNAWTVHGVWPTKIGTMGPNFCNSSWKFEISQLQPIESQMEQYWTNIEKDTPLPSLWEHEWSKHGTCAALLSTLDNEKKYFAQGLIWLQHHSMTDILSKAGIYPNDTNTFDPSEVYDSVKRIMGKNPSMHCSVDAHTGISYLFELRICFDKNLNLVDCDGVKVESDGYGNLEKNNNHCDVSKPLVYPSVVPPTLHSLEWKLPLVEIYKLIMWLRWFTL